LWGSRPSLASWAGVSQGKHLGTICKLGWIVLGRLERERGREDGAQIKHENSSDFPESGKNK